MSIDCSKNGLCKDFSVTNVNIKKNPTTKKNVCNFLVGSDKIPLCKQ